MGHINGILGALSKNMGKYISVALDGPSGSGKSTLAKVLASRLGYVYIDTGALYRTIGLYICKMGIDPENVEDVVSALSQINIKMSLVDGAGVVFLDGVAVGNEIRTPEIAAYASNVSKIPQVRAFLLDLQRKIAAENNVIMDGRDIGTVILPNAQVKIFLTANNESRALRRYKELAERGENVTFEQVLADLLWRDKNDSEREISPAVPATDSVMLDNSGMTCEETVNAAIDIIKRKIN